MWILHKSLDELNFPWISSDDVVLHTLTACRNTGFFETVYFTALVREKATAEMMSFFGSEKETFHLCRDLSKRAKYTMTNHVKSLFYMHFKITACWKTGQTLQFQNRLYPNPPDGASASPLKNFWFADKIKEFFSPVTALSWCKQRF